MAARWTELEDARLQARYARGEPVAAIAGRLGRSEEAVSARRRLLRIEPRRRPRAWSALEDRLLRAATTSGAPAVALAARLGRSVGDVRARRRRLGLRVRAPRRYSPAEDAPPPRSLPDDSRAFPTRRLSAMPVHTKRVYEPPAPADGYRVLVDRMWPRGIARERAAIDEWARELAPSDELRRWYGHDPQRFEAFARRYRAELADRRERLTALRRRTRTGTVTLLFAARDAEHSNAAVLARVLRTGLR